MTKETKEYYRKKLKPENFKSWFIEDFGTGAEFTKIDLVKKENFFEDGKKALWDSINIEIEVYIKSSIFLNRTLYFEVHFVDFDKKKVSGYIQKERFADVLYTKNDDDFQDYKFFENIKHSIIN